MPPLARNIGIGLLVFSVMALGALRPLGPDLITTLVLLVWATGIPIYVVILLIQLAQHLRKRARER